MLADVESPTTVTKTEPLLDQLFQASRATHSPLSFVETHVLKGDASQINSDFTVNLIHSIQCFLKEQLQAQVDMTGHELISLSIFDPCLNFMVILKKIANSTEKEVGTVLLKLPVTKELSSETIEKALSKHIKKELTSMRNIRFEWQFVIGTFNMEPNAEFLRKLTATQQGSSSEFHFDDLTL